METSFEDDIYLAVLDNVSIVLGYLLFGRIDGPCVHTAYKVARLGHRVQCEQSTPLPTTVARYGLLIALEVAMVYLATAAIAGGIFMFCSFWIYHYIDLDYGSGDLSEHESEAFELRSM